MRDHDAPPEAQTTMRRLLHDVRTPLGQILGYAEMLEEEVVDRDHADLVPDLQKIRGAAQRVLQLVDGLFRPSSAEVEGPPGSAAPLEDPDRSGLGGSLLIVDDDAGNRDLLGRRLARAGYRVEMAKDGREALHRVEEESFDLVLLDVLMPGIGGFEVLAALRRTRSASELPVIMATALDSAHDVVRALRAGANDYVTKPFDLPIVLARIEGQLALQRAAREIEQLARQLELHGAFMRKTFGRYVSEEIVTELLASPEGLDLRGERRRLTVLVADLRGFSTLPERLSPVQVVSLLNNYLGEMAEVLQSHAGTIDEFLGDGILAFFGAPVARADHAEAAVACAIDMQLALARVNERNQSQGLPEIEMGIGVATGDVIVGNIGSEARTKYGAVGSAINLAGRIESYTLGGEVLICPTTAEHAGDALQIDDRREIHPKGFEAPITVHRVIGVEGGGGRLVLAERAELRELEIEIPIRFAVLEGKQVGASRGMGRIEALSPDGARIRSDVSVAELTDLRIELVDGDAIASACYGKVVGHQADRDGVFVLRFTSRSAWLDARLDSPLAAV